MSTNQTDPVAVEQLKPCPFCGSSDVELRSRPSAAFVACNNCGARTGTVYLGLGEASDAFRKRVVIAAWNTRQPAASDDVGDAMSDLQRLGQEFDAVSATQPQPSDDVLTNGSYEIDELRFVDEVARVIAIHADQGASRRRVYRAAKREIAAITTQAKAQEAPSAAMINAGVDFAINAIRPVGFDVRDYVAGLYQAMVHAQAQETGK